MPAAEVDWILSFPLGDPEGAQIAARIDRTIAKLPGLEWFDRLMRSAIRLSTFSPPITGRARTPIRLRHKLP
jgi:hypothetical protein